MKQICTTLCIGLIQLAVVSAISSASTLSLGSNHVRIEMTHCRVEIAASSQQEPQVQIQFPDGSEAPPDFLKISMREGRTLVQRRDISDTQSYLVMIFTLHPNQDLEIEGTDLDLTITDSQIDPDEDFADQTLDGTTDDQAGCTIARLLNLTGGTAHVIGGGCTNIVSNQADLILEKSSQALDIQATGSHFNIRGHRGSIVFDGHDGSEGTIVQLDGPLKASMDDCQMTVEDSDGAISGQFDNSTLTLSDYRGSLEFPGSAASVIVQNSQLTQIRLTGTQNSGWFFGGQGHIRATLDGGSLNIEDWTGRLDLQASQDTTIEVESLEGDFAFSVENTSGEVTGISGHTRGNLTNSDLRFSHLKSIEITAKNSDFSVIEVPQLSQVNVIGGHLIYESTRVLGKPKITLSERASADVVIPQPCIIRGTGPGAKDTVNISVSGCEFRTPDQPWGKRHRQAKPPIQFEINMDEDTEIVVSGY